MKKLLLTFSAALALLTSPAGIISPTPAGQLSRAVILLGGDVPQGASDALTSPLGCSSCPDVREQTMLTQAEAAYHRGLFNEADGLYKDFCRQFPGSIMYGKAILRRAQCAAAQDNFRVTISLLSSLPGYSLSGRNQMEAELLMGVAYLQGEDFIQAENLLSPLAQNSETSSAANYYLGYITLLRGDYTAAAQYFSKSDVPEALCYRVLMDYLQQNWNMALQGARSAVRTNLTPAWRAEMDRIAGESLFALDRPEEGMSYLRRYLGATTSPVASALLLAGTQEYASGDMLQAERLLTGAADAPGAIGQMASLYLGQALYRQGRMDAAILAFERAARMEGTPEARQAAYFNFAASKFAGAQVPFSSSVEVFEDFISQYPSGPYSDRVREYLAEGYLSGNNFETALERLDAIRNPGPRVQGIRQYVLYVLGTTALNGGDNEQASQLLSSGAQVNSNAAVNSEIILSRARLLNAQGQYNEAVELFRNYLRTAPAHSANIPHAHYGLGYALYGMRQYPEAGTSFTAAQNSGLFQGLALSDILARRADIASYSSDFGTARDLYMQSRQADIASGDYALLQAARMEGYLRRYSEKLSLLDNFSTEYENSALMPDAMLERTQALISLGRRPEAVETYRALIEAYPLTRQGRQGYLQMALTLLEKCQRENAEQAYRDVISRYPSSEEAIQAASLLRRIYAEDGRGDEYLAFMESVDGAPGVDREDAAELSFGSATRAYAQNSDTAPLERFITQYPDTPQVETALEMLANSAYRTGDIPRAQQLWEQLESRASTPEKMRNARLGIMRTARDLGDLERAGSMARTVLDSGDVPASVLGEATYVLGFYLAEQDNLEQAVEVWNTVADRTAELYGAMSAFSAADGLFRLGRTEDALNAAQALTSSLSPHYYWVARAFIIISDIYAQQGRMYEAKEYIRALSENYPGNEPDIRDMISTRLQALDAR